MWFKQAAYESIHGNQPAQIKNLNLLKGFRITEVWAPKEEGGSYFNLKVNSSSNGEVVLIKDIKQWNHDTVLLGCMKLNKFKKNEVISETEVWDCIWDAHQELIDEKKES